MRTPLKWRHPPVSPTLLEEGDTGLGGEGTWTGRLSCDVFSDEEVSVQVLVRNRSGHPLINNTYIDSVDVDE